MASLCTPGSGDVPVWLDVGVRNRAKTHVGPDSGLLPCISNCQAKDNDEVQCETGGPLIKSCTLCLRTKEGTKMSLRDGSNMSVGAFQCIFNGVDPTVAENQAGRTRLNPHFISNKHTTEDRLTLESLHFVHVCTGTTPKQTSKNFEQILILTCRLVRKVVDIFIIVVFKCFFHWMCVLFRFSANFFWGCFNWSAGKYKCQIELL